MKTSLSIGLTGGIGSGKTLITRVFSHLGVPIYKADDNAKNMYSKQEVIEQIVSYFGQEVIVDGMIDKKKLASIVFKSPRQLRLLSDIVHPLVKADYELWKNKQDKPYVIMESAIIYESNWQNMFDKVICVFTPKEIAIKRVIKRDNITRGEVLDRMKNQKNEGDKKNLSDYVIVHDNNKMLIPQILSIHQQLIDLSQRNISQK